MGTPIQWGSLGVSNANASSNALGVWGNSLHMGYQDAVSASQQSSGLGSALGLVGSLAMAPATGGGSVFAKMFGLADGGLVPDGEPAVGGYAGGGIIPPPSPFQAEFSHGPSRDSHNAA